MDYSHLRGVGYCIFEMLDGGLEGSVLDMSGYERRALIKDRAAYHNTVQFSTI